LARVNLHPKVVTVPYIRLAARRPRAACRSPSWQPCTRGYDCNRKAACSPHYSRATLWYAHRLSIPLFVLHLQCYVVRRCVQAPVAMDKGKEPGARRYQAPDGRERLA